MRHCGAHASRSALRAPQALYSLKRRRNSAWRRYGRVGERREERRTQHRQKTKVVVSDGSATSQQPLTDFSPSLSPLSLFLCAPSLSPTFSFPFRFLFLSFSISHFGPFFHSISIVSPRSSAASVKFSIFAVQLRDFCAIFVFLASPQNSLYLHSLALKYTYIHVPIHSSSPQAV